MNKRNSLYGFETREPDRRRSDRSNSHNIKQLWQRSHEIIGLAIQGHSQKDIAGILNVSPGTVSNTLNSDLGMKKLSEMREERDEEHVKVAEVIERLSKKALEVYEEIFDNDTVGVKLKKEAADTVLMDLGGHRSPTKIDTRSLHVVATDKEIEGFRQRGLEAAKASGMLIDISKPRQLLDPPDRSEIEQTEMEGG